MLVKAYKQGAPIIYRVKETEIEVEVLSMRYHYR